MAHPTEAQVRRLAKAADALLRDERRSYAYRMGYVAQIFRHLAQDADVESAAEALEIGFNNPPDFDHGGGDDQAT